MTVRLKPIARFPSAKRGMPMGARGVIAEADPDQAALSSSLRALPSSSSRVS